VVEGLVADGLGNSEIAEELNGRGERSVRGGAFTATSIRRLRARLAA
jgi:DNA-binding NarL/FixJ family response regulator